MKKQPAPKKRTTKKTPVRKKRTKKTPVRKKAPPNKTKIILLNTSQLAFRFKLTREITARRLNAAGVAPVEDHGPGNEKLYALDEATPFLETDEDINELKKRKLLAEARDKEMTLEQREKLLLSSAEVKAAVQTIFGNLLRELSIKMTKRIAGRCKKAKTIKEINAIMKPAIGEVFDKLRTNHKEFLVK